MNKEYMHLSDGKVAVTNEEGNIEIREFENNGLVRQILDYENIDEVISDELDNYKNKLDEQQRVQYLCKKMMIFQPLVVFLLTFGGFIYGGAFTGDFLANGIYNGTFGFVLSSFLCGGAFTYFATANSKSKKKIKALEEVIKVIEKKKDEHQNVLNSLNKLKSQDLTDELNKPISLETKPVTDKIEMLKHNFQNTYDKSLKPKTKRLVLSRKRK